VIINIQEEKHKLVQGRQGIEGIGRFFNIAKCTLLAFWLMPPKKKDKGIHLAQEV